MEQEEIYSKFLRDQIIELGVENLPVSYQEIALSRVMLEDKLLLGKVRYNDKILHQSKIIKFYIN